MKYLKSSIIAIIILFCLPGFVLAGQFKATVLKITDRDTIWVKTQGKRVKLRLLGIDTPEKYHSKKMTKDLKRYGVDYYTMRAFCGGSRCN